jgi:signal transduction histidine kinase
MRSTVHEMRNQLSVSVASLEAFIDGKLAPTPERLRAVLYALRKLEGLLLEATPGTLAAMAPPKLQPVDLCALVLREVLALEATAQAAGIRLHVDRCALTHAECSVFVCDPVQVGLVMTNILLNAIKYSGRGGTVTVYGHREPGVVALDISDTGPGIPISERQSIFECGVRGSTARSVVGSGVGLSVVQSIIHAHGGSVRVAESGSGGALFTIRLPGISEPAVACASDDERSPLVHGGATPVA